MKFKTFIQVICITAGLAAAPVAAQNTAEIGGGADGPAGLKLYFALGAAGVGTDEQKKLDQAARLFRDGNPVVMTVTGTADTVGSPADNLDLSIRRARAVADGLVDRGIPIERLQILGAGNSELPVTTDDEVPNEENRSVTITWR